jgi:ElaB/YqjD/DUF883 family membrane-anchored ribosome-binding protein
MSSNPNFPGSDAAKNTLDRASDAANQAASRASDLGREAFDKIDSSRGTVADGFQKTADAVKSYAPASMAQPTADAITKTADYIRSRDLRSMTSDLTAVVRRNPGPSLIAGIAVGFLLGAMMRRD